MTHLYLSDTQGSATSSGIGSIDSLLLRFRSMEALENPDAIVPLRELKLNDDGTLAIPGEGEGFELSGWAKNQLAALVGVKWDRWFGRMDRAGQATEINMRLSSFDARLRVRTVRTNAESTRGVVRALVTPTFSPLRDSDLLGLLREALEPVDPELRIIRADVSERSVSYVLGLGRAFTPGDDHKIGDVWGGILVQNSGVGAAALGIVANFTRLLCKNGMTAPIPGAVLLRRAHRSFNLERLRDVLFERLRTLPGKLAAAADALVASRQHRVDDARIAFEKILRCAGLPLRLVPDLEQALEAEPALRGTAFGISQATTRAAQKRSPEERVQLEHAAGAYVADLVREGHDAGRSN